jgi:hypothetical protein
MPYVGIKPNAFPRCRLIDLEMGWPKGTALGKLCLIWKESQELGIERASRSKVLLWAEVEPAEADRFLAAAQDEAVRFLVPEAGGTLFINGNRDEIDKIKARQERSRAGGLAGGKGRAKKDHEADEEEEEQPRANPGLSDSHSLELTPGLAECSFSHSPKPKPKPKPEPEPEPEESSEGHSANTPPPPVTALVLVEPPKKPKKAKAPPGEGTPSSRVWRAYAAAYEQRYAHAPGTSARNYALCAQLVARLGTDDAEKVVAFFLTHTKRWYLEKVHDLGACVADAEGLRTQMLANHRVTSSEAQLKDRFTGNIQAAANVYRKLKAEGLFEEAEKKWEGDGGE